MNPGDEIIPADAPINLPEPNFYPSDGPMYKDLSEEDNKTLQVMHQIKEELATSEQSESAQEVNGKKYEHLAGTTDVLSSISIAKDEFDNQWLYFRMGDGGSWEILLDDFLLCFRLFNMVWYSNLIKNLDICINTACPNKPYGAHVRAENCLTKSPYQRMLEDAHENDMRNLRRQEALRIASLDRESSDQTRF